MRCMFVLAAAVMSAGCDFDKFAPSKPNAETEKLQQEELKNPTGRFVVAGKREFPNGSEIYVLDTKMGQVCYYFVASGTGDNNAQKTDFMRCAGEPLVPVL